MTTRGQTPELVELSRERYAEDTLGYLYFPTSLEGRMRPIGATSIDLDLPPKTAEHIDDLTDGTLEGALHLTHEQVVGLPAFAQKALVKHVRSKTQTLESRQLVTPAGKFVEGVWGAWGCMQGSVEASQEQALSEAVDEAIGGLKKSRARDVLRKRYGLDTWKPRTLESVGKDYELTRERIRSVESRAFASIRRPDHPGGQALRAFMTTPDWSLARQLGVTYVRDLTIGDLTLEDVGITDEMIQEFKRQTSQTKVNDLSSLLTVELEQIPEGSPRTPVVNQLRQSLRAELKPALVFGDLWPEVRDRGSDGLVDATSLEELYKPYVHDRLEARGLLTLGSLIEVEKDENGKPPVGPVVAAKIDQAIGGLNLYLDTINEQLAEDWPQA